MFTIVFLPVGFVFYTHLLCYDQNLIPLCNLYVMSCLFEVHYDTVHGSVCSQPQSIKNVQA